MGRHQRAVRLVGTGTAAFGLASVALPGVLARLCGLDPAEPGARMLAFSLGMRDLVSGAAILTAPDRRRLRTALLMRGAFDAGDVVASATMLPEPWARRGFMLVAGTWSALSLSLAATL
jgi:hypothetical protein